MRINIRTIVNGHYQEVIKRFDLDLFNALLPKFMPPKLIRFDGSQKGDIVHLQLPVPGFGLQDWKSEITEDEVKPEKAWFTDVGIQLPFFLSSWKHRHIVEKAGDQSVIVDDIQFRSRFGWLIYPFLYLAFFARKPIYRRYFAE